LATVAGAALASPLVGYAKSPTSRHRDFHVCLAPPLIEREPELLEIVRAAGVSTVWLAGFFYGFRTSAKRVLLWNLLPEPRHVTVSFRGRLQAAELGPIGSTVLEGFPATQTGLRDDAENPERR